MGQIIDVNAESDKRTVNNTDRVRHNYRVLSEAEKAQMVAVKDMGVEFLNLIDSFRTPSRPIEGTQDDEGGPLAVGYFDRELTIAAERVEEAVMWAVKHITAPKEASNAS